MISPPSLKLGDTIGIISTARKINLEELQPAIKLFEEWGLKVKLGENLFKSDHQFCGNDAERGTDLQSFIDDPSIKAIICARGGYGTVRIIDDIDFTPLKTQPKWIGGYSDVTVLLNSLFNEGLQSLHCPMPIGFSSNTSESLDSLKAALFGQTYTIDCESHSLNKIGMARGKLVGGNLSILYSLMGSKTSISTKDNILFIEDLDEYLYHIDRMMMNMKRNGYLEHLRGIIVGGMNDMNDNAIPFGQNAEEIISKITEPYKIPICFGFPSGHIDDNRTLIFGRDVELLVGPKVSLSFT